MTGISRQQLKDAYHFACEMDILAFKPGNVSVFADGHDMIADDFKLSANVSVDAITDPELSLGEKIFYAIRATREAVGCNTNLGIVLLAAPLIQAVLTIRPGQSLQDSVNAILANTTIQDAEWVFKAITLASPGGLGESEQQDVSDKPSVTLTQAMALAAEKDRVAYQYKNNYKDIFDFSIIRYNKSFDQWGDHSWAVVAVYAALLSKFPDSHIERKYGNQYTRMVSAKMALLDQELSKTNRPEQLEEMLYAIDREFKSLGVNPGTTADLTVTTVLVDCLEQLISGHKP